MNRLHKNNLTSVGNLQTLASLGSSLNEANRHLSKNPQNVEIAFIRAQLLWKLGRTEESKNAYMEILLKSPTHFGALNNLGVLLHSRGFGKAARICYGQAASCHPNNPMGHVNFANSLVEDGELSLAREHLEKALALEPDHAEAHQGLACVYDKLGDEVSAELHRRKGFKNKSVIVLPYRGQKDPVRVLLLTSATRGNATIQKFLNDLVFHVVVIIVEYFDRTQPLPAHQLIVNAVGNADLCKQALLSAERIVALSSAPVVNLPGAVIQTDRVSVANRLKDVPGVITPTTINIPRVVLDGPDGIDVLAGHGFTLPFLLRAPGFNNGLNFFKINNSNELGEALKALPGQEITAIQFLDARGEDGKIRKYRVMMVDGEIYPLHVAIAHQWKIHYVTAEMADNPEHRAEDEEFLENMEKVLGPRAMTALKQISEVLSLDYGGIDFSMNANGDILLFEANATMNVNLPDHDDRWAYRRGPVERILGAIRKMLTRRVISHESLTPGLENGLLERAS